MTLRLEPKTASAHCCPAFLEYHTLLILGPSWISPSQAVIDGWHDTWPDIEADIKWKIRLKLGLVDRERMAQHHLRLWHW